MWTFTGIALLLVYIAAGMLTLISMFDAAPTITAAIAFAGLMAFVVYAP